MSNQNLVVSSVVSSNSLTMTSKEIAELTGKLHKHVIRDIENMLSQLYGNKDGPILDHEQIQGVTIERDNRNYISLYRLDKDHTITLLTGYDAKARMAVVKRWQELEAQSNPFLAMDEIAMLEYAIKTKKENAALALQNQALESANHELESEIQELEPKAEIAERIASTEGLFGLQEASKLLQKPANFLGKYLLELGWAFKKGGKLHGYMSKINAGSLRVKTDKIKVNGMEFITSQLLITAKGLYELANSLNITIDKGFFTFGGRVNSKVVKKPRQSLVPTSTRLQ